MKTVQILLLAATLSAGLLAATSVNANLVGSVDGQTVYDNQCVYAYPMCIPATGISWVANANLAATNTFGVNGIQSNGSMTWSTAQSWIGAMNIANYLGYHDWRLPDYNSDEMAILFNEMGGLSGLSLSGHHNSNYALFQNLQPNIYWSNKAYGSTGAYVTNFDTNWSSALSQSNSFYVWAVRPGQVAAVPVPAAAWLMGSGLLGLIGVARRKTA